MKCLSLVVLSTVSVSAFALDPVGTYVGAMKPNPNAIPKKLTPAQKKEIAREIALISQLTFTLNIKPRGVYTSYVTDGKKTQSSSGTWKLSGSTLVVRKTKQDGKPYNKVQDEVINISPDGRLLTIDSNPKLRVILFKK